MTEEKSMEKIAEEMEDIYREYEAELKILEDEQAKVLDDLRVELEEHKAEEIKKTINN